MMECGAVYDSRNSTTLARRRGADKSFFRRDARENKRAARMIDPGSVGIVFSGERKGETGKNVSANFLLVAAARREIECEHTQRRSVRDSRFG